VSFFADLRSYGRVFLVKSYFYEHHTSSDMYIYLYVYTVVFVEDYPVAVYFLSNSYSTNVQVWIHLRVFWSLSRSLSAKTCVSWQITLWRMYMYKYIHTLIIIPTIFFGRLSSAWPCVSCHIIFHPRRRQVWCLCSRHF